jgi:hypothetical protein
MINLSCVPLVPGGQAQMHCSGVVPLQGAMDLQLS